MRYNVSMQCLGVYFGARLRCRDTTILILGFRHDSHDSYSHRNQDGYCGIWIETVLASAIPQAAHHIVVLQAKDLTRTITVQSPISVESYLRIFLFVLWKNTTALFEISHMCSPVSCPASKHAADTRGPNPNANPSSRYMKFT